MVTGLLDIAKVLDSVLLDFRSTSVSVPTDSAIKPVIELLEALQGNDKVDYRAHMVQRLVRHRMGLPPRQVSVMIDELRNRAPSSETMSGLEQLASALDEERALQDSRKVM